MSEKPPKAARSVRRRISAHTLKIFALPVLVGVAAAAVGVVSIQNGLSERDKAQNGGVNKLPLCEVTGKDALAPPSGLCLA